MNILFFHHNNFGAIDVVNALTGMGHHVRSIDSDRLLTHSSEELDAVFDAEMKAAAGISGSGNAAGGNGSGAYDLVFTFNYSPVISNNCKKYNIKYISYVYDSPQVLLYSYTLINPCNYVFIFDKTLYNEFKSGGIETVYYMPLAADAERMERQRKQFGIELFKDYTDDITFIGSMYNEDHNLFDRLKGLDEHTKGYLDAIMAAQLKVYGYYFIEELLTPDILEKLQKSVPYEPDRQSAVKPSYIYSDYFIGRKLANMERTNILSALSKEHKVSLYTHLPTPELPNVINKGKTDYYDSMPQVFATSKINLNISLRSIRSGIPLRCIDIMAAGGFLMSNYQADFYDFFEPGKDLVLYESVEDLINKCDYYLEHEDERIAIARSGYEKVRKYHSFQKHLSEMIEIAGLTSRA